MERSISSYRQLENMVPEIMAVLKNDKALSDMILDMINNSAQPE